MRSKRGWIQHFKESDEIKDRLERDNATAVYEGIPYLERNRLATYLQPLSYTN
jgi:hypothetical protein